MIHYVYLVENHEKTALKIGTSVMPESRAGVLSCRLLYTIHGDRHTEKALHKKFRSLRLSGEWFKHSTQIISYFIQSGGRLVRGKPEKPAREVQKGMVAFSCPVHKDTIRSIRSIAKERGMFMQHLVREALTEWVERNAKRKVTA